jgi:hypothetical protein
VTIYFCSLGEILILKDLLFFFIKKKSYLGISYLTPYLKGLKALLERDLPVMGSISSAASYLFILS